MRSQLRTPYDFEWDVPDIDLTPAITCPRRPGSKPEPFLVERAAYGSERVVRRYQPLEKKNNGLFRTFAELKHDDDIIKFARRYGFLGQPDLVVTPLELKRLRNCLTPRPGESLNRWQHEIRAMRDGVRLWDALQAHPVGTAHLRDVIIWKRDKSGNDLVQATWRREGRMYRGYQIAGSGIVDSRGREMLDRFRRHDLIEPARRALQVLVNDQLKEHPSRVVLLRDQQESHLSLFVRPSTLLSAMWLQFSQAIDGGRDFRRCKHCDTWFEVGGARRVDAQFCDSACKQKDYRKNLKARLGKVALK
jgi:hypothetical protein